jgi:phosphate transport system substrate-binding protein
VNLKRHGILAGIALTATLALAACGSDNTTTPSGGNSSAAKSDCATGSLTAQGSTAQKNAMDEWIKAYQAKCSGATINYQGTGSSAGITAFNSNSADFAGSDSALKTDKDTPPSDETTKATARCGGNTPLNLPFVVGPIAVAYNLSGVKDLQLKPATLAKIFGNKITKWDAPEIKADNPNATLPSSAILAVHRSDGSGTTGNFTKYLAATAASDWTFGSGNDWKAPGGQGEAKSDGVAGAVAKSPGAIGYVELSFAQNSNLAMAKIFNGAGEYTALTDAAAGKTIAGAQVTGTGNDLRLKIDYGTKEAGAYPIVLVTYEIVCSKGADSAKVPLLKSFLKYAASTEGQTSLSKLGYAPLPDSVRSKVATAVDSLS